MARLEPLDGISPFEELNQHPDGEYVAMRTGWDDGDRGERAAAILRGIILSCPRTYGTSGLRRRATAGISRRRKAPLTETRVVLVTTTKPITGLRPSPRFG